MELRQIRYFVAAAEQLNLSRASIRVHISQPAISRAIRDLECEVQTRLFIRHSSGLHLTPAGKAFLHHARLILDECQSAINSIRSAPAEQTILNIGFILPSLASFLGNVISILSEEHPELEIRVHELSPAEQIDALRKHEIDIAFFGNQGAEVLDNEFRIMPIIKLKLEAVLPAKHTLAQRAELGLEDLLDENFIGYVESKFPGRNKKITKTCISAGFSPKFCYLANSIVEILGMIGVGRGVSLLPSDVVNIPHPNVVFVPIKDEVEPIFIIGTWLSGNQNAALLTLIQQCEKMTQASLPS